MSKTPLSLQAVIAPRSIALVGASDDPSKATSRPLKFLTEAGFSGQLHVVNPRRESVAGHRAFPSVTSLPSVPEHVLIMTPAATVPDIVEECADRGVQVVTILSDGFAESGPEGAALQARIVDTAARTGLRIIGPNSIGAVNVAERIPLTGNAVFGALSPEPGGTFLVSQSGSMIGGLVTRGEAAGTAFSAVVSSGGEIDVTAPELALAALEDPRTTQIILFLEHISDPTGMAELGARAAAKGIPVIAFKLGRSDEASELTVSHTGALAGDDALTERLLVESGVARVTTLGGLLTAGPLLSELPMRAPGARQLRVGVLTTTGGAAAMVVDELAIRGCEVAQASSATVERLRTAGISAHASRIVDLTLAGASPDTLSAAIETLGSAEEFDSLIVVLGSSARLTPEASTAAVIAAQQRSSRPLSVFLVPEAPEARRLLQEAGIVVFTQPETVGDVYAAAAARREPVPERQRRTVISEPGETGVLDEVESYATLARLGVRPPAHRILDVGADGRLLTDPGAVEHPSVVKILDPQIAHKSDIGGVVLGVSTPAEIEQAAELVAARANTHLGVARPRRVLVQTMCEGGLGELLIGYRNDPHVGPVILAAAGGIQAELYQDRAVRLAPCDLDAAREMLDEITAVRQLTGYRNLPRGDVEGAARLIVALSELASDPTIVEAEINPLLVEADRVVPVDCLVRRTIPLAEADSGSPESSDLEPARSPVH